MLITRCRQLPDGEELVWAEEGAFEDGLDPRDSAINRRGLALSQTSVRRSPRPASDKRTPAPMIGRVKLKVEWR